MIPQEHKDKKLFKKIQYYLMLFRWFLIGRYHCEDAQKYRKYYNFVHKLLWLLITLGVISLCRRIIEWISLS